MNDVLNEFDAPHLFLSQSRSKLKEWFNMQIQYKFGAKKTTNTARDFVQINCQDFKKGSDFPQTKEAVQHVRHTA